MKKALTILALSASALLAAPAMAADSPWYAGATLGHSSLNGISSADSAGTSGSVFGGYQLTPRVAAELGYARLGDVSAAGLRAHPEMLTLQGVASMPLDARMSVFAKAGVAYTRAGGDVGGHRFAPVVGVGAEYALNKQLAAIAQVQYVHNYALTDAHMLNSSLGLKYRF